MKKTLLVIALAACGIAGATAQKPATCATANCNTANCTEQQCAPQNCKNNRTCASPFEGLNLTADQQTKLNALKQECTARQQQQRRDCQKANAERKGMKTECRRTNLAKIKEILTPEQYVTFLENAYVNGAPKHQGMHRHGDRNRAHNNCGRQMQHNNCPNAQQNK